MVMWQQCKYTTARIPLKSLLFQPKMLQTKTLIFTWIDWLQVSSGTAPIRLVTFCRELRKKIEFHDHSQFSTQLQQTERLKCKLQCCNTNVDPLVLNWNCQTWLQFRGSSSRKKLGGGMQPASWNLFPISDQTLRFSSLLISDVTKHLIPYYLRPLS